jgi:carotenoid 1,2-hydratase
MNDAGLGFDHTPPATGYVWWYVDALSDDGVHGLTMIAMLGNVFSPYYAWRRRRGGGDPMQHCALNVALYGKGGKRWAMTERGADAVHRTADTLNIGRSRLAWDGGGLTAQIDELGAPLPRRIRGQVRLIPASIETRRLPLDGAGRHFWRPIAPCARLDVLLQKPALTWSGPAYFDCNWGERPLESDFERWQWSRAAVPGGTAVTYDVVRRAEPRHLSLAMRYDAAGGVADFPPPLAAPLRRTGWRVRRSIGTDAGASVIETLEDTPFYARSVIRTHWLGQSVTAMHESLSLDRFASLWVQAMLPFRMPRAL